jgi:hypothetical protein
VQVRSRSGGLAEIASQHTLALLIDAEHERSRESAYGPTTLLAEAPLKSFSLHPEGPRSLALVAASNLDGITNRGGYHDLDLVDAIRQLDNRSRDLFRPHWLVVATRYEPGARLSQGVRLGHPQRLSCSAHELGDRRPELASEITQRPKACLDDPLLDTPQLVRG